MAAGKDGSKVIISGSPAEVASAVNEVAASAQASAERLASGKKSGERPTMNELVRDAHVEVLAFRRNPVDGAQMLDPNNGTMRELRRQVEFSTPTTMKEIEKELEGVFGGYEWRVEAYLDDEKIGGTTVRIKKDPLPVFEQDGYQNTRNAAQMPPHLRGRMGGQPGGGGFWDPDQIYDPRMDPRYRGGFGRPRWYDDDDDDEEDEKPRKLSPQEMIEIKKAELEIEKVRRRMEREEKEEKQGTIVNQFKELLSGEMRILNETVGKIKDEVSGQVREIRQDSERDIREVKAEMDRRFTTISDLFREFKHAKEMTDERARNDNERARSDLQNALRTIEGSMEKTWTQLQTQLSSMQDGKGVMEVFGAMQQANQQSFTELNKTMLTMMQSKQEGGDFIDRFINGFGSMASLMGLGGEGPKDATTIIAETSREAVPKLFEWLSERSQAGKAVTQEAVNDKINEVVKDLAPTLGKTMMSQVNKAVESKMGAFAKAMQKQRGAIPAPKDPAAIPDATPTPTATAPGEGPPSGPLPSQVGGVAEEEPAAKEEAPAGPSKAHIRQQYKQRIDIMLQMILTEIELQPNEAEWVDFALENLPRPILKQFVNASSPEDIGMIIAEYADQKLLMNLGEQLMDIEKRKWLERQFKVVMEEFMAQLQEELGVDDEGNPVGEAAPEAEPPAPETGPAPAPEPTPPPPPASPPTPTPEPAASPTQPEGESQEKK